MEWEVISNALMDRGDISLRALGHARQIYTDLLFRAAKKPEIGVLSEREKRRFQEDPDADGGADPPGH